jgi:hypothetical protein
MPNAFLIVLSTVLRTILKMRGCGMTGISRTPSLGALLLGLVPFIGMCFSVALWDRIDPMLFGIPFNLFWLICWIVLSTGCLWGAYRVEAARETRADPAP